MKKNLLTLCFLGAFFPAMATHIVGGELELEHLDGYFYNLKLILYFDDYYGDPLAEDPWALVGIYSKSNDALVASVVLYNRGSSLVNYTNPECVIEKLDTRRILYTYNEFYLSPSIYNDPAGYYIVWERCCRNNVIDNIVAPERTAQTFYLEFPPVVKDGKPFINSSPQLFPPLSDYACVNRDFYADFRGFDKDGDSLVYSLTTPWSGHTSDLVPALNQPLPQPYAPVIWQPGIDVNNQIPGTKPLQISNQGILKVNPAFEGLFVFAVKCEEFRDGVKIGEVRRDFQMLAIACHEPGSPPSVMIKTSGDKAPTATIDTLKISGDEEGCFQLYVSDPDTLEKITVRTLPVNFDPRLDNLFKGVSGRVQNNEDTLILDLCLPGCPVADQSFAVLDVIVMDDECSIPLMDTARLVIDYRDVLNRAPFFTSGADTLNIGAPAGTVFSLPVEGLDEDGSPLQMTLDPVNFNLPDFNVRFNPQLNEEGRIKYLVEFNADCSKLSKYDTDTFQISLTLTDFDKCGNVKSDRLVVNFIIETEDNTAPEVATSIATSDINIRINQSISFSAAAKDADNDLIEFYAVGEGFNLEDYGIMFNPQSGFGSVGSAFSWTPGCDVNIEQKDEFRIFLIAEDYDKCLIPNADTAVVNITVRRPENRQPAIISGIIPYPLIHMEVGQTLEFNIGATDQDGDSLYFDLVNLEELQAAYNIQFEPQHGISPVASAFSYTGDCGHLSDNYAPRDIELKFYVHDNKCYNQRSDTLVMTIRLFDAAGEYEKFLPANVFTPNGDETNEYFTLPNLPRDNCFGEFESIKIYDRWGGLVFESTSRDFAWRGDDGPSGVYFYIIRYSSFVYKGYVSMLK